MSLVRKSVAASSLVSRSPCSTLAAIASREGSLISARSTSTGRGTGSSPSLPESTHGERHVVAAETEAVADRRVHIAPDRLVGRVVQVQIRISMLVIYRRRDDAVAHRERAEDELHGAGRAEHVASH